MVPPEFPTAFWLMQRWSGQSASVILIFPFFNIVAQNPVQPKDSTVGKDELIIISPEKKVHSDTSELMIIRDSSQKHKEANISELFIRP